MMRTWSLKEKPLISRFRIRFINSCWTACSARLISSINSNTWRPLSTACATCSNVWCTAYTVVFTSRLLPWPSVWVTVSTVGKPPISPSFKRFPSIVTNSQLCTSATCAAREVLPMPVSPTSKGTWLAASTNSTLAIVSIKFITSPF